MHERVHVKRPQREQDTISAAGRVCKDGVNYISGQVERFAGTFPASNLGIAEHRHRPAAAQNCQQARRAKMFFGTTA